MKQSQLVPHGVWSSDAHSEAGHGRGRDDVARVVSVRSGQGEGLRSRNLALVFGAQSRSFSEAASSCGPHCSQLVAVDVAGARRDADFEGSGRGLHKRWIASAVVAASCQRMAMMDAIGRAEWLR